MTIDRIVREIQLPARKPSRPLRPRRKIDHLAIGRVPFDSELLECRAPETVGIVDAQTIKFAVAVVGSGGIERDSERVHQALKMAAADVRLGRKPNRRLRIVSSRRHSFRLANCPDYGKMPLESKIYNYIRKARVTTHPRHPASGTRLATTPAVRTAESQEE